MLFLKSKKKPENPLVYMNFGRYTDNLFILGTSVGQFTFAVEDCDFFIGEDRILFLFSRKNALGKVENFDLKIDNSLKNKDKNREIIAEFFKRKNGGKVIDIKENFEKSGISDVARAAL